MRRILKLAAIVISVMLVAMVWTLPAMAATNQATDPGGGDVTLSNSGTVSITSSQLALVKAVFDTSGNCLASSDSDCNGTSSVSVPTGMELVFVLYVSNTTQTAATDIRFRDSIDDAAADYFEFQAAEFGAGQGIMWATRAATGATKANIWTALTTGTALTNALDGSTGTNEYCGIDTTLSPDQLDCGGDIASPNNDQRDVAAGQVFAVKFHVIKRD